MTIPGCFDRYINFSATADQLILSAQSTDVIIKALLEEHDHV